MKELRDKIKVGNRVYIIYDNQIIPEKVFAISDSFFMIDPHITREDSWEWYFDRFRVDWFFTLEDAKSVIAEQYEKRGKKVKFKRAEDMFGSVLYEIQEVE